MCSTTPYFYQLIFFASWFIKVCCLLYCTFICWNAFCLFYFFTLLQIEINDYNLLVYTNWNNFVSISEYWSQIVKENVKIRWTWVISQYVKRCLLEIICVRLAEYAGWNLVWQIQYRKKSKTGLNKYGFEVLIWKEFSSCLRNN